MPEQDRLFEFRPHSLRWSCKRVLTGAQFSIILWVFARLSAGTGTRSRLLGIAWPKISLWTAAGLCELAIV